jgi:hypothetical protein
MPYLRIVAVAAVAALPALLMTPALADAGAGSAKYPASAASAKYPANIEYDPSGYGKYNKAALTNPNIGAVDISLNWSIVEPKQGDFNFGPANSAIKAWAGSPTDKKVTLELRFQHEASVSSKGVPCTSDGWLPTWVVAHISTLCDSDAGGLLIPDYFNKTFLADWKAYVKAVADHFANSRYKKSIEYVRTAVGLGAEGFPLEPCFSKGCMSDYQANQKQLVKLGYSATAWVNWQKGMMSYYKHEFAYTTVIYPINQMFFPVDNSLNTADGHPVQVVVAEWAAANGMGLGSEGLAGRYTNDYSEFPQIDSWVLKNEPNTYIQFQTVAELRDSGTQSCDDVCLLGKDIQAAEAYGARSIEWYSSDDLYQPFQSDFANWQQYVNKRFG